MYAIIDIETTGGNSRTDRITEIAIFVHDGEKITAEFSSLINPECRIPYYITELTGITDKMVEQAPKFYEVAKQIVQLTEGTTIVAHNAKFDYHFIRNEFKSLGYEYSKETLCTVKLSRKLLPGHASYSLGKLCRDLNIDLQHRHRAAGDAAATVKLFELLLQKDGNHFRKRSAQELKALKVLEQHPLRPMLNTLPEKPGVYYLYNEQRELIYVGKSNNIKSRITTHLGNYTTQKAASMTQSVADIGYELTGSELIALLKESEEIKKFRPIYNRAQIRSNYQFGLMADYELDGYLHMRIERLGPRTQALTTFTTREQGRNHMERLVEQFELCRKLTGLFPSQGACFHYGIKQCHGACVGHESAESYNERARQALELVGYEHDNFIIIDQGREPEEKAVVCVENGRYLGYGFIQAEDAGLALEALKDRIKASPNNRDVQMIIKNYLENGKVERVITY
ncbi:MAG: exonuclease domain-containing protein [Chitinophagales bacterium]|nr:exonuclease domain-containing protein [Chitinophagales bacterium]